VSSFDSITMPEVVIGVLYAGSTNFLNFAAFVARFWRMSLSRST